MTDSNPASERVREVSRRGMLKWTGALAAAGVVGIGLGLGGDLLLRPNNTTTQTSTQTAVSTATQTNVETATQTSVETATATMTQSVTQTATQIQTSTATVTQPAVTQTATKTATQTQTQTVTTTSIQQPVTLSYVPPLSPSVQMNVNNIISNLVNSHAGEQQFYSGTTTSFGDLFKVVIKNGAIVGAVPEDIVNPSLAREDAYIPASDVWAVKTRAVALAPDYASPGIVNTPTRVLYPMLRVGNRGDPNGQFVRITWTDAISRIAAAIQNSMSKYGPNSMMMSVYASANAVLSLYGAGILTYGSPSWSTHGTASGDILGVIAANTYVTELKYAKLIVLWGFDPTSGMWAKNGQLYFALAREMGIPIIAIDPRLNSAVATYADQWIPIRPGTDITMMLAIANVLFKGNLYNQTYVSKFVEPTGFAKWKDYVLGNSPGPDGAIDRTPEWAAPICGVPAATIRAFAQLYAQSQPAWVDYSIGPSRSTHGIQPARAAIYLQAMTGNIGVLGGYTLTLSGPAWPGNTIGAPAIQYNATSPTYVAPNLLSQTKIADTILLRDQYNSGQITKQQFYGAIGNNINNPAPNLHFFMTFDSHRLGSTSQYISKHVAAIKQLDMFVQAARQWDASSKLADIVLPLTQTFEEEPTFATITRGFVYVPNLLPPQGESRSTTWINVQIANALGLGAKYNPVMANVTWDQWMTTLTSLCQQAYTTWAASSSTKTTLGYTPPAWSDFLKQPVIRATAFQDPPPTTFTSQITGGQPFTTASGKIEFYNSYYETFDLSKIFYKGTGNLAWNQAAARPPMATWVNPPETYFDPNVAKYPLELHGTHSRYVNQTQGNKNPMIYGEITRVSAWISVADANARGINDGDLVKIYNDRGTTIVPAYVTSKIVPGMVWMWRGDYIPNTSGDDLGGANNVLTGDDISVAEEAEETVNALVQLEKV